MTRASRLFRPATFVVRPATFGAIASLAAAISSLAIADDPAAPQANAVAAAAASLDLDSLPIEELARRLDSDSFDERQAASEALAKRGAEATPLLEKLAIEGTREAKSRSLDLLIGSAKADGESEAKTAARAALERLAQSADAYASRRAGEALAPPAPATEAPRIAAAPRVQVLPIGPGLAPNIRVQALVPNGKGMLVPNGAIIAQNGVLKVQRRNVNGEETIEAEEGDRKTLIKKTVDGKIAMEIVEKKDGKETTEKFAADSEADLKAKSAKAYELYKKHAGDGGVQAQIIVGNALPGGFPGGIPGFAPAMPGALPFPAPAPPANEMRLEMLKRMLQNVQRQEQRLQEEIDALEKELQAQNLPAEAPAVPPEKPVEEAPVEGAPAAPPVEAKAADEAPAAEPQTDDRDAGSDANGGSDD